MRRKRLAVKLLFKKETKNQGLQRKLAFVRRLPLNDIPIAQPRATLEPPPYGYVMELLTDMACWRTLLDRPSDRGLTEAYVRTGGLRRRLRLLAYCADALNQLHGKGLVYGDLSPNNVLISTSPTEDVVYLIDADNLRYESAPGSLRLHTPGYGAPEIVRGRSGVNSLTDAHAFAVLAFKTLSLVHPLLGDEIEASEPELEQRALQGQLPWIDHPEDEWNRSSHGIPREVVLSPLLQNLADRTFREGLNHPLRRPGISEWAERLHGAADNTLRCPRCDGTYYRHEESCPWCDAARPDYLLLRFRFVEPKLSELCAPDDWPTVAVLSRRVPGRIVLTRRMVSGRSGHFADVPAIEIETRKSSSKTLDRLWVRSVNDHQYRMVSRDQSRDDWIGSEHRQFPISWKLHLGPDDEPHRFVEFKVRFGSKQ